LYPINRAASAPSGPSMISVTTKSFLGSGRMWHAGFAAKSQFGHGQFILVPYLNLRVVSIGNVGIVHVNNMFSETVNSPTRMFVNFQKGGDPSS